MTDDQLPAIVSAADLERALVAEIKRLYKRRSGSFPDPETIPVLAELALGDHGDPEDCPAEVERLLLDDVLKTLPAFDRFNRQQLGMGHCRAVGHGATPGEE